MNPKQQLPAIRIAIGGGAFAAPELTAKIFGLTRTDPESVFLGRLFGIRDIALGIGQLVASGEAGSLWWQLGVVCDAADAVAAVLMLKAGGPKRAGVMSAVTALNATVLGVLALTQSSSSESAPA
jgi:hypothetical protein